MSAVSSDNNVLVIKTVQIAPFRTLMTALKDILLETNITFQKDVIRIINMDKSHTILAHLHLNAENFEKYECKKDKIIVGVNKFKDKDEDINSLQNIDISEVKKQIKGLSTFKKTRNNIQVNESLKKLQITAKGNENIMPDVIHCVKNNCTLGEISDTLRLIFGEY